MTTTNVIDLQPLIQRRKQASCAHQAIIIDAAEAELECKSCGKQISPYWYLEKLAENWEQWESLHDEHKRQCQEYMDKVTATCNARIEDMNRRVRQLGEDINRLQAEKRALMNEQVGGVRVGDRVERWRRVP